MVECQLKSIFYNCDDKYFLGHKCKEHKIFMAISEDVVDKEAKVSLAEEIPPTDDPTSPFDPPTIELLISLHALTGFFSPQTLKLIGYI